MAKHYVLVDGEVVDIPPQVTEAIEELLAACRMVKPLHQLRYNLHEAIGAAIYAERHQDADAWVREPEDPRPYANMACSDFPCDVCGRPVVEHSKSLTGGPVCPPGADEPRNSLR